MSALRLEGVSFRYPGAAAPALDGCSLAVAPGELAWLYGPLGAGITTLLTVAAGLAPRFTGGDLRGTVRTLGRDPSGERPDEALLGCVAFVSSAPATQLSGLARTVRDEVAFAPANLLWPADRIAAGVDAALARLGISALAHRDPATLSGGEMQRVVIASMAVLQPALWLLDEPASALDAEGRAMVATLLRAEAARGAAVVLASEDVDTLGPLASRLVVLRAGRVVLDGPPASLLASDALWDAGAEGTTLSWLGREARRPPPYPLTVDEAVAAWRQ